MKKLTIAIIAIVILIGAGASAQVFFKKEKPKFSVAEAQINDITEKVSVTGSLVPLQRIDLEPKTQQEVKQILAKVSDKIQQGMLLIQLDQRDALIQVDQSNANLDSVQQNIDLLGVKLQNAEKNLINVEQTATDNVAQIEASVEEAKTSLETKQQSLNDVEEVEQNKLEQAREDILAALEGIFLRANEAYWAVESLQRTYFYQNDQESFRVRNAENQIKQSRDNIDAVLQTAQETEDGDDIDKALSETESSLSKLYQSLSTIREICGQASYYYIIASADKTILDTEKSDVNTAILSLISVKQAIESQEISGQKNINTAQAVLDSTRAQLNSANSNLNYAKTQREQQISQAQSQIEQLKQEAQLEKSKLVTAQVGLAQAQKTLEDTRIIAPMAGTITKVNIEQGETAKPGTVVISMIPEDKYKIEADVSEVNIGKIKKEGLAEVEFDAFPDEIYQGQVSKISPAEIVKEGVIYYRIEVLLNQYPIKLKPGFTANLDIIVGQEKNAVTVPYVAVKEDEQGKYVQIVEDDAIKEQRRVETGLETDTSIEITKGLESGEKVVLYEEK